MVRPFTKFCTSLTTYLAFLFRGTVSVYAQIDETTNGYASLQGVDRERPLTALLEEFQNHRWGKPQKLQDRQLAVRFVALVEELDVDDDEDDRYSKKASSARASKRKPPRTHWTRNPITLQAHPFKKITCSYAEDGRVTFSKSDVEDSIEIPHPKEWELENAAGFIGKGASKRGLYARYKGMEYVITQPMDEHLAHDDVELILKKEMELLCQCHGFKKVFDQHAVGNLCNIVAFKFNFEDAFIGELKPSMTSQSRPLPRLHFLATPLLPCGSFDKKIQKFTGNDVVGEATTAHHEAIHAFAHFSYLYSQGYLVFCDLQGMLDKTGIMCLIDPQVHTRAVKREDRHAYWDGGPNMVNKFLEDHYKGCSSNRYCKRLKLCGANPETFEIDIQPSHPSPRRPEKKPKKHDLNFLINGQ
ncbi:hypothetical protein EST38_g2614 [Candolleomyces aberdarensis]|uniref:Alpha-type protein kinase domain-containing protein n=1 Tax=Candolleomyces aberdarensis TaxID=2316362 RepID=A0A4Q2DS03_9AGAR|nr:hypothetical protein EST38_g2614 [Candolleomyces aberdarensis]